MVSTSVNADRITNDTTIGAAIIRMDADPAAAWEAFLSGVGEPCGGPEAAVRSVKEGAF